MALSLVTGPAVEPVSLSEAKQQCRVDQDITDEDALLDSLRVAARQWAENFTHRALITQTWDDKRDGFPCEVWELPLAPAVSVTSVTYIATDGTSTVWSSALYTTDFPAGPKAGPGRLCPIYGGSFPSTQDVMNAVVVRFVAGYGSTAAASLVAVPMAIKQAIRLLVAHWYAQREPVNIGNLVTPIPLTIESLLWPYKHFV